AGPRGRAGPRGPARPRGRACARGRAGPRARADRGPAGPRAGARRRVPVGCPVIWLLLGVAFGQDCSASLPVDQNCNGFAPAEASPVDVLGRICATNLDDQGRPFATADWYGGYETWGCQYPVDRLDVDGDGFGAGSVPIGEPYPHLVVVLSCDNCPNDWNPD